MVLVLCLVFCLVPTGGARGVVMHVGWGMLFSVLVSMLLVLVCLVVTRMVVARVVVTRVVMTVAAGLGGRGNSTVMAVLVGCCTSARQVLAVLAGPCRLDCLDCLGCCSQRGMGLQGNVGFYCLGTGLRKRCARVGNLWCCLKLIYFLWGLRRNVLGWFVRMD